MMASLSPALDATIAAPATGMPTLAIPAEEGGPFAAVIQGLASGTAAQPASGSLPQTTLPDSSDPLTAALVSMLQALGLSENPSEPELATPPERSTDSPASTDASRTDSVSESILQNITESPATPPSMALLPASPAIMPAQLQAQQWLAALAPAQVNKDVSKDSADPVLPSAAASQQALTQPLPATSTLAPTPAAQVLPFASAMQAGNAWLQQPQASFFSMSASTESSPAITDVSALTATSSNLLTDAPKGMPSAMSFAQTLGSASGNATAPVLTTVLPHAVQDPAWSDAFGQRVALLAQQGTQTATLQLNPPELGPIQVRIAMSEQGAKVEFNTSQQTTSDLIETAMPRLAAALEHQGLRLDDSRVNLISNRQDVFNAPSTFASARQDTAQGDRGQTAQQQAQHAARQPSAATEAEGGLQAGNVIRLPLAHDSGIDYYA